MNGWATGQKNHVVRNWNRENDTVQTFKIPFASFSYRIVFSSSIEHVSERQVEFCLPLSLFWVSLKSSFLWNGCTVGSIFLCVATNASASTWYDSRTCPLSRVPKSRHGSVSQFDRWFSPLARSIIAIYVSWNREHIFSCPISCSDILEQNSYCPSLSDVEKKPAFCES